MKSKIFLFVNISGIFFLMAAFLNIFSRILVTTVDFSNRKLEALYYIGWGSDVSLFLAAIFLVIAGSNYNFDK